MDPDEPLPTRHCWGAYLDADAYKGEVTIDRETGETGYYATPTHSVTLTRAQLVKCIQLIDNDERNRRMENR